jgi:hypothetical protein
MTREAVAKLKAARDAQRKLALDIAMERRQESAALKRAMRDGKIDVFALIEGNLSDTRVDAEVAARAEEVVGRWTLDKLLLACPGIGKTKRQDILTAMNASPAARVGTLTYARRKELATLVRVAKNIRVRL